MKYVFALLLLMNGCMSPPALSVHQSPLTVYLIISYTPDKQIERVFATKKQATDYIAAFSNAHDYSYEELILEP